MKKKELKIENKQGETMNFQREASSSINKIGGKGMLHKLRDIILILNCFSLEEIEHRYS